MRARWLEERESSGWRRLALLPLAGIAWLYSAGALYHRAAYARGWRTPRRLASHVISVGNLTVGGNAKTPTAAWLALALHRRGRKVVLASRGYGRRSREPVVVVSDGRYVREGAETAGDEPLLLAAHAPGVPVLVGDDRALVGQRALAAFGADVVVLDDGFQHHRLHRDLDLVNVDARAGFGNGWVLPRGPLREPLGALGRADAIGVIDGELQGEDESRIARVAAGAHRFSARRRPARLRGLAGGSASRTPEALAGEAVGLIAGIAAPGSFRRTLEGLGARVVAERVFGDHHVYRASDLRGLAAEARLWITTEKDALKIVPSWVGDVEVEVLTIQLEVEEPERLLDWIESRLR